MRYKIDPRTIVGAIPGALLVLVVSAGAAPVQDAPFQALFGAGYDFLQKEETLGAVPDRSPVQDDGPFQTLFVDSYAVTRAPGQQRALTEPIARVDTETETSPFEALFGEGYDRIAPR